MKRQRGIFGRGSEEYCLILPIQKTNAMKKLIIASVILLFLFSTSYTSEAKDCVYGFHVGSRIYYTNHIYPQVSADTIFYYGDTINLPITVSQYIMGCGACSIDSIKWMHNSIQVGSDTIYTVHEIGDYTAFIYFSSQTCFQDYTYYIFNLHVGYTEATGISFNSNPRLFKIYPSVSSTIFNIQASADYHPKKISVVDGEGRIVYSSSTNFSEINLTYFSNGIYFYAVEDEFQKVFRGKIIKN